MSQRNSEYDRKPYDLYETPTWVTAALLDDIGNRPLAAIWEPAAGSGLMSGAIRERGYNVYQSDIQDDTQVDFLGCPSLPDNLCRTIITNPPYGPRGTLARFFIDHALALTKPVGGIVAMLLRIDYDSAKTRRAIFGDCPAWSRKLVLRKRIQWFGHGKNGASENHAWYVWDWSHSGPATIGYAP